MLLMPGCHLKYINIVKPFPTNVLAVLCENDRICDVACEARLASARDPYWPSASSLLYACSAIVEDGSSNFAETGHKALSFGFRETGSCER